MDKGILKSEIKNNINEIRFRVKILNTLIKRYFFNLKTRNPDLSFDEYDNHWDSFWEKGEIFRKDLPFTKNDIRVDGLSPFDFKKEVIVKVLTEKISEYKFKAVLEVGSGAGLNLLFLAPFFPEVKFYGLEPTDSGVRVSTYFVKSPPKCFMEASRLGEVKNVHIIKGSILELDRLKELKNKKFDFVFTSAALEQLNNYLDQAFSNIFSLSDGHFLFYEEWLEGNYLINNYMTLVDSDYFRISWNYLNRFKEIETIERTVPALQPSWLKYAVVFAKKASR